jgi:uncharacterized phage protein gp47/JayE
MSLFKPLDKTPRHSLLKVFSSVDAGIYHQLLGDLDFLALQIFPDTATGAVLREHWSHRVTPMHATSASGTVLVLGIPGRSVPAGLVFSSASGERYYTEKAYTIGADGTVTVNVRSTGSGFKANLEAGQKLKIISAIPAGVDSTVTTTGNGIAGGTDADTDADYLSRVLVSLQNPSPYGKPGDFAGWALDSGAGVSAAWEMKNFGPFGALLVRVVSGNQFDGVYRVGNLEDVTNYINVHAPPVAFTVLNLEIIKLNPVISLLPREDSLANRDLAENRMRSYLQLTAKPGHFVTAGALRESVIDGINITDATVKLAGSPTGTVTATVMQYPYIGEVVWE